MRIIPTVAAERDSKAKAKNYIPVSPFQGVTIARRHQCIDCGHEGTLTPNKYWGVGRGCPKCGPNRRGVAKVLTSKQIASRDKKAKAQSYSPYGPYKGNHKKRLHRCQKCSHEGKLTPAAYWNNGTGCPVCAKAQHGQARKLTLSEVAERDKFAKHYDKYPPTEPYVGLHKKRHHKCKVCGYVGGLTPSSFWNSGVGCPKCSRVVNAARQTLSSAIVARKDSKAKNYLTFPPQHVYIAAKSHRKHICLICHTEKQMTPDQFWRGGGCLTCAKKLRKVAGPKKDISITKDQVKKLDTIAKHSLNYPPAECEEFLNKSTARIHECQKCGYVGELTPRLFWHQDKGCPICNRKKLSIAIVEKRDRASKYYSTFPPQTAFEGTALHRLHECLECGYLGLVKPNSFWQGNGCKQCNFKLGEHEVSQRDRRATHADTYPPSADQKYSGIDIKRVHQCTEPKCGYTGELSSYNFWKKDVGCPKCADKRLALANTFTSEEVLAKDQSSKYYKEYPPIGSYLNALTPRLHQCPEHGENWTAPCSFWADTGCPICAIKRNAEARTFTTEEVSAKDVMAPHIKNYPPISVYKGALIPRQHRCEEHGENWTAPSSFWVGTGCPGCAVTGFNTTKSGILYYLRVQASPEKLLYKIGITNRSVNERFTKSDLLKITVLKLWSFEIGGNALKRETEILRAFKEHQYKGEQILSSGNTELFLLDVLEMDCL